MSNKTNHIIEKAGSKLKLYLRKIEERRLRWISRKRIYIKKNKLLQTNYKRIFSSVLGCRL